MPREDKPKIPLLNDTVLIRARVIAAMDDDGDILVGFRSDAAETYIRPMDIVEIIAGPPRKDDLVTDTSRVAGGDYRIVEISGQTAWLRSDKDPSIQYLAKLKDLARVNNT